MDFPIPTEPEKVIIDVYSKLAHFEGRDIIEKASSNIKFASAVLAHKYNRLHLSFDGFGVTFIESLNTGIQSDVTVHKQVVKEESLLSLNGTNRIRYL